MSAAIWRAESRGIGFVSVLLFERVFRAQFDEGRGFSWQSARLVGALVRYIMKHVFRIFLCLSRETFETLKETPHTTPSNIRNHIYSTVYISIIWEKYFFHWHVISFAKKEVSIYEFIISLLFVFCKLKEFCIDEYKCKYLRQNHTTTSW